MTSDKQIAANRENAQKSTGPKTEAGKNRSKLNAVRHNLTGQVTVMTEADRIACEAFTLQIVESLQPATAAERQLAQAYATAHWRINRATVFEEGILTLSLAEDQNLAHLGVEQPEVHTALANAATFRQDPHAFALLSLYTNRLIGQSEKLLKQLNQLQSARKARDLHVMDSAVTLLKYHDMKGLPFSPGENGFVFSTEEIRAHIRRCKLKSRAENARDLKFDPVAYAEKYEKLAA